MRQLRRPVGTRRWLPRVLMLLASANLLLHVPSVLARHTHIAGRCAEVASLPQLTPGPVDVDTGEHECPLCVAIQSGVPLSAILESARAERLPNPGIPTPQLCRRTSQAVAGPVGPRAPPVPSGA